MSGTNEVVLINTRFFMFTKFRPIRVENIILKWINHYGLTTPLKGWLYLFKCVENKWYFSHEIFGFEQPTQTRSGQKYLLASYYTVNWGDVSNVYRNNTRELSPQSNQEMDGIIQIQHYDTNGEVIQYRSVYSPFQLPWDRLPEFKRPIKNNGMWEVAGSSVEYKNEGGNIVPAFTWADNRGAAWFSIPDIVWELDEIDYKNPETLESKLVTNNTIILKNLRESQSHNVPFPSYVEGTNQRYAIEHCIWHPFDEANFFHSLYSTAVREYEVYVGNANWAEYQHDYPEGEKRRKLRQQYEDGIERRKKFQIASYIESVILNMENFINTTSDEDEKEDTQQRYAEYKDALTASEPGKKQYRRFIEEFDLKKQKLEREMDRKGKYLDSILNSKRYLATVDDVLAYTESNEEQDKLDWEKSVLYNLELQYIVNLQKLDVSRSGRQLIEKLWADFNGEKELGFSKIFSITRKSIRLVSSWLKIFMSQIISPNTTAPQGLDRRALGKFSTFLGSLNVGGTGNSQWNRLVATIVQYDVADPVPNSKAFSYVKNFKIMSQTGTAEVKILNIESLLSRWNEIEPATLKLLLVLEVANVAIVSATLLHTDRAELTNRDAAALTKALNDLLVATWKAEWSDKLDVIAKSFIEGHKMTLELSTREIAKFELNRSGNAFKRMVNQRTAQNEQYIKHELAKLAHRYDDDITQKCKSSFRLVQRNANNSRILSTLLTRGTNVLSGISGMLEFYMQTQDLVDSARRGDYDVSKVHLVSAAGGLICSGAAVAEFLAGEALFGSIFGWIGAAFVLGGVVMAICYVDDSIETYFKNSCFGTNTPSSIGPIDEQYSFLMTDLIYWLNCSVSAMLLEFRGEETINLYIESGNLFSFDEIHIDVKVYNRGSQPIHLSIITDSYIPAEGECKMVGDRIVQVCKKWVNGRDVNFYEGSRISWVVTINHFGSTKRPFVRTRSGETIVERPTPPPPILR